MSEIALRALRQPPRHRADAVTDTTLRGAARFDFHTGSGRLPTSAAHPSSSFRSGLISQPPRSSTRLLSATSARRTAHRGTRKSSTAGRECERSWMKPSSLRHPNRLKARRRTSGHVPRSIMRTFPPAGPGIQRSAPTRRARCIAARARHGMCGNQAVS